MFNRELLIKSLHASLPAAFGYVPLGLAFGLFCENELHNWWIAPLMSFWVYAGAAQFAALSLLLGGTGILSIVLMTFIINLRHVFYGLPFLKIFKGGFWKKQYLIFGITDESYSILTASSHKNNTDFCFWVTVFTHAYWVVGSLVGAVIGAFIPYDLAFLEFSLVALFTILAIEQYYAVRKLWPIIVGVVAALIGHFISSEHMLFIAMAIASLFMWGIHIKEKHT